MSAGAPLLQLHTDRPETFSDASAALEGGYEISGADAKSTPLILDRITP